MYLYNKSHIKIILLTKEFIPSAKFIALIKSKIHKHVKKIDEILKYIFF